MPSPFAAGASVISPTKVGDRLNRQRESRRSTVTYSPSKGATVRDRFEAFVTDRLDRLLRYATALTCDPHLAQDVVQDVLLRVQDRWSRIEGMHAPEAYVRRMITNEYLSWRRRRAARTVASTHSTLDALGTPVDDPAGRYAERDAMRHRIARLPRKQRAAILLRYYEDCTDAEIAEVLGCTAGTVRSHISRALATLRTDESRSLKEALA
jgi:RNA polymerase sigma-70 factor (sigma-E family)